MSIRTKVIVFLAAFLMTALIVGLGSIYLFSSLGGSIDLLDREIKRHHVQAELRSTIRDHIASARGWAITAEAHYRQKHAETSGKLQEVYLGIEDLVSDPVLVSSLRSDLKQCRTLAQKIINIDEPLGNIEALRALNELEIKEESLLKEIDAQHAASLDSIINTLNIGERVKTKLSSYLTLLVLLSLLTTALLIVLMRRLLVRPFHEIMRATEIVSSGDLSYRIFSKDKDEFGLISNRFDSMVESFENSEGMLKQKLSETELLLDVAGISGQTEDLSDALDRMVSAIARKLGKDVCLLYLSVAGGKAFALKSSSAGTEGIATYLPADSPLAEGLLKDLKPIIVDDASSSEQFGNLCRQCGSFMVAPLLSDEGCDGLLVLGKNEKNGFAVEEMDVAVIMAHSIGTTIKNKELYDAAKNQLGQLSVLYSLSKALTSVFEPEKILSTITSEVLKLTNAKGCVIRLLKGEMLEVVSFAGDVDKSVREVAVPLGKGIAGRVAKEGKPVIVDDIAKMPREVREQSLLVGTSAIAVPLKVEDRIIGTLGLYDKLTPEGVETAFSGNDLEIILGMAALSAAAIDRARMQRIEREHDAMIIETNKRLDLIFDSVQGGIVTLDRDFKITAANQYMEKWSKVGLAELRGKSALDVFHGEDRICPHCAAKGTFEGGGVNSITLSSGLNYAELSSYPLLDAEGNVSEAVVFIQDITDRVLYQEEIMGLYKEVMQTKEYMESLIANSADAIVTSDLDGVVISWNPAAETIYGYKSDEAIGHFLPFIPESLLQFEDENRVKIGKAEVLKLETLRKRKDNLFIEVSLTLSPIKDVTGEVIGISGISRDISDKKRIEKELVRRNQELSRLFFISAAMRGTLDLEKLQRMVLTAVTVGGGLGFNRAILMLLDDDAENLIGVMGVGPSSAEEAWRIWDNLSMENKSLREIMDEIDSGPTSKDSFLDRLSMGIRIPLEDDTILTRAVKMKRSFNVRNVKDEALSDSILIQQLGTEAYAVVPLISRDKVVGVLWVDNLFNKKEISDEDMTFLDGLTDQVASAMEGARLFSKVSLAEAELENIFSSISDMVFFTDRNYTVKKVNQAVIKKLGLPEEEIIGTKCYKTFHNKDVPWVACPHSKTMVNLEPNVEELLDDNLGGTFLASTSPIFDEDGHFLGTVHLVKDITEMKELQDRVLASERMAALGEVAAKVAHEIRNPLVSVGGFAKRLETNLDGDQKEYARIIANEVERLEGILREILGFVREVRMSKKTTDLNVITNDVLHLLDEEFSERGNTVSADLAASGVIMVVDPNRIKEAIYNVISNANQATESGRITLRTYGENGNAVLEVADTGCGINSDDLVRIFDPFFTTRPTGTGLGLAIAKRIVEEHDGTITVKSDYPAGGSRFKISLPAKEAQDENTGS